MQVSGRVMVKGGEAAMQGALLDSPDLWKAACCDGRCPVEDGFEGGGRHGKQ